MSGFKKVEHFTRLEPLCAERHCSGKCPECGGCTDTSYGVWGSLFGVARLCMGGGLDIGNCTWNEVTEEEGTS